MGMTAVPTKEQRQLAEEMWRQAAGCVHVNPVLVIAEKLAAAECEAEQRGAEREHLACIAELRKYGFHAAADELVEAAEARKELEKA